jgi:hypothetical protein
MGAATAIRYMADNHEKIASAVLDSCFASFEEIVYYLAQN